MPYTRLSQISAHNNSESRLVYFAGSDDSEDQSKPKSRFEDFQEGRQMQIARMTNLKSRVFNPLFDDSLKGTAQRIIANYEEEPEKYEEELLLLEEHLDGGIDKKDFKKRLTKLREARERAQSNFFKDQYFSDRVSDVYVDNVEKLSQQVNEMDETCSQDISSLKSVNKKLGIVDTDIRNKFYEYIRKGEISAEQVEKIIMLDPSHNLFKEKLKELMGPLAQDTVLFNFVSEKKAAQAKLLEQAEEKMFSINNFVRSYFGETEFLKQRRHNIRQLQKQTGLDIDEGQEFDILIPTEDGEIFKSKAKIKAVDFEAFDSDLDSEKKVQDFIENGFATEAELKIKVTYTNADGQEVEEDLNDSTFKLFTIAYQAAESIENQDQFKKRINAFSTEPELKEGQEFEYVSDYKKIGKPEYSKVSITNFDPEKGEITLSEPILVNPYSKREDSVPHKKNQVSLGEFLKWMKLTDAVPEVGLDKARIELAKYPELLQKRLSDINVDYQVNQNPIQIVNNELIKNVSSGEVLRIENVSPTEILLNNGKIYSPSQFLKFVKENGMELYSNQTQSAEPNTAEDKAPEAESTEQKEDSASTENTENNDQPTTEAEQSDSSSGDDEDEKDPDYYNAVGSGKIEANEFGRGEEFAKNINKDPNSILEARDVMPPKGIGVDFIDDIVRGTTFLSLKNIFEIGSTVGEFIVRRWNRKSKARMAKVGSKIPFVGPEFDKITQQTENEEVSNYQDIMKDFPVIQIRDRLKETSNKDELKACMNLLSEKGALRFDDPDLWTTLNRVAYDEFGNSKGYELSINMAGGKNNKGLVPADAAKDILDELYGEESGKDWFNKNLSSYNSAVNGYSDEANSYEGDPKRMGGIAAELHNMLIDHMNGVYVDTGRFEGFIDFIIKAGKAGMTDKIFYLIAGVAMENDDGKTLLDPEVYTRMTLKYQGSQLPLLEWFTRFKPEGFDGTVLPKDYLKDVVDEFDFKRNGRNKSKAKDRYDVNKVNDYLTKNILPHSSALSRASRAIRNAKEMDHDDTQYIIPYLNKDDMQQSVVSNTAGDRSAFTADGFLNGFAGFSQALKTQGEVLDGSPDEIRIRKKLNFEDPMKFSAQLIKSFVCFESSATGRRNYGKNFLKVNEKLGKSPPADLVGKSTLEYIKQVKDLIKKVADSYGMDSVLVDRILNHTATESADKSQHEGEYDRFNKEFDAAVASDNGARLVRVMRSEYKSLYGC